MSKTQISAEILADSINEYNDRITTWKIVIPRIVLAELNTHRVFSRNSASSRAIPFKTMVEKVRTDPFVPIAFQKDHKGMQGTEYFSGVELIDAQEEWLSSRDAAVTSAINMNSLGCTKQLCNRLLEPFLYHTVICTSTEWENFYALRAHSAAEIHIAKVAEIMLEKANASTPKELRAGEWHIPFGDMMDIERIMLLADPTKFNSANPYKEAIEEVKKMVAVARCARVSYLNYEGTDDYEKDVALYKRLRSMGHQSPFEHVAYAMGGEERCSGNGSGFKGNFRGWVQDRFSDPKENRNDSRYIRKTSSISKVGEIWLLN